MVMAPETICASGMLVSSLFLGIRGIKKSYVKILCVSLAFAGIFIIGFGLFNSISLITMSGFGFFLMLPFANNCLDFLVRSNIPDKLQGRIWGIVGFMSQIGYVIAYGCSGILADFIASVCEVSVGKGAGLVITISGFALIMVSIATLSIKEIRLLEFGKEK